MNLDRQEGRGSSALESLRRFVRPRVVKERCELCGVEVAGVHPHLVEVANRRLLCACDACAILFNSGSGARFRRVPRQTRALKDFSLTDIQWESLHLPINLAFFLYSTPVGGVVAFYPSPAGATESNPAQEAWQELVEQNPVLRDLEPDVEALLVNRLGTPPEYYRIGIDECYRLVGLIRTHWRGLSGGTAVWEEIGRFFAALKKQPGPKREVTHS